MRLRPSGRSGPLATQIDGFASYQENEAWTWEHLALTRARVVSASPAFAARIEEVIRAVLTRPRDAGHVAGDVVEMRRAIAQEKGDDERWDLKYAAGGLIDIEFIAQYLQLVHAAAAPELLDTSTARVLDKAWRLGLLEHGRCRGAAPGGAALSRPDADPAAVPAGPVRSQDRGARAPRLLARAADVPDFATLDAIVPRPKPRCARASSASLAKPRDAARPPTCGGRAGKPSG